MARGGLGREVTQEESFAPTPFFHPQQGGCPLSGWGLWNVVDLLGAAPGDGRPVHGERPESDPESRTGQLAEVMVWWLEVALRPLHPPPPAAVCSEGPLTSARSPPSPAHGRTLGIQNFQSQELAMELQSPPFLHPSELKFLSFQAPLGQREVRAHGMDLKMELVKTKLA